jgi:hypothetical protein
MDPESVESVLGKFRPPPPPETVKSAVLAEARRRMGRPLERPPWGARVPLALSAALFLAIVLLPILFLARTPLPGVPVPGQSQDLASLIEKYAKGDDSVAAAILKKGAQAMLLLRDARGSAPARVDRLVYELKKALAGPREASAVKALEAKGALPVPPGKDSAAMTLYEAYAHLTEKLPLLHDPQLLARMGDPAASVSVGAKEEPYRDLLDSICRQAGFDYGFFYGYVLVSTPERLWPERPRPDAGPLGEKDVERARRWIEALNSDNPDDRSAALRGLKGFGRPVLPLLEKALDRKEPELAARVRDLVQGIDRPLGTGLFGAPALDRQKLEGADAKLREALRAERVSFKVVDIVIEGALALMLQPRNVPYQLSPAVKGHRVTLDLQNVEGEAIVALLCHSAGMDVMIRNGELWVDTREEIERAVGKGR